MPSFSYTASSSFSFSSSSTNNGRTTGTAYTRESHSTPQGSATRTTNQGTGQPTVQETRFYDGRGREVPVGPARIQPSGPAAPRTIEDVSDESDADRLYRERMEDEYAKREGGA